MEVTIETKTITIPSTPQPTPITIAFFKGPDGEVIELFENQLT
jgi:glyoxylase I family protein